MAAWSIALPPKALDDFSGIENGDEVAFEVVGRISRRDDHGSVVIDVHSIEVRSAGSFKEAAKRAKTKYLESLIQPSVG
jgi:hypothetical protein